MSEIDLLIKNARLVDLNYPANIAIKNGKIAMVKKKPLKLLLRESYIL